jgi:pyruvate/2-oxoglutarate dehydrogenase complex dihydrolipoamide acyltransferase (E2) component
MATNALGAGTCNLSVNVPRNWRRLLGRLATTHDVSMGELMRRMVARAAHVWAAARHAATAEQADLEAITILRNAIQDGISEQDRPAIERALYLIQASADSDRKLASGLAMETSA